MERSGFPETTIFGIGEGIDLYSASRLRKVHRDAKM